MGLPPVPVLSWNDAKHESEKKMSSVPLKELLEIAFPVEVSRCNAALPELSAAVLDIVLEGDKERRMAGSIVLVAVVLDIVMPAVELMEMALLPVLVAVVLIIFVLFALSRVMATPLMQMAVVLDIELLAALEKEMPLLEPVTVAPVIVLLALPEK
jgi:hypothetical protein